jgi:hypothetical protein
MKSSSKRRFLPINSGWTEAAQSDRPPKIGFARNAHCTPVSQRRLRLTQQKKRQRTLRVDPPDSAPGTTLAVAVSSR